MCCFCQLGTVNSPSNELYYYISQNTIPMALVCFPCPKSHCQLSKSWLTGSWFTCLPFTKFPAFCSFRAGFLTTWGYALAIPGCIFQIFTLRAPSTMAESILTPTWNAIISYREHSLHIEVPFLCPHDGDWGNQKKIQISFQKQAFYDLD